MIKQWDVLREKCPSLYRTDVPFECGFGWYDILHDLSTKIEAILQQYELKKDVPEGEEFETTEMFAVQVKEKYGTLRFYMSCETCEIMHLIHEAEALSSQTCEVCGAPAKMRGRTWIEVRCDDCFSGGK